MPVKKAVKPKPKPKPKASHAMNGEPQEVQSSRTEVRPGRAEQKVQPGDVEPVVQPGDAASLMNADPLNPPSPSDVRAALQAKADENEKINDDAFNEQVAANKAHYEKIGQV